MCTSQHTSFVETSRSNLANLSSLLPERGGLQNEQSGRAPHRPGETRTRSAERMIGSGGPGRPAAVATDREPGHWAGARLSLLTVAGAPEGVAAAPTLFGFLLLAFSSYASHKGAGPPRAAMLAAQRQPETNASCAVLQRPVECRRMWIAEATPTSDPLEGTTTSQVDRSLPLSPYPRSPTALRKLRTVTAMGRCCAAGQGLLPPVRIAGLWSALSAGYAERRRPRPEIWHSSLPSTPLSRQSRPDVVLPPPMLMEPPPPPPVPTLRPPHSPPLSPPLLPLLAPQPSPPPPPSPPRAGTLPHTRRRAVTRNIALLANQRASQQVGNPTDEGNSTTLLRLGTRAYFYYEGPRTPPLPPAAHTERRRQAGCWEDVPVPPPWIPP